MKIYNAILLFTLITSGVATVSAQTLRDTYFLEAEEFQFTDRWIISNDPSASGHSVLKVEGSSKPNANAYTAIMVDEKNSYNVWTRAVDFKTNKPSTRLFKLFVNGIPMNDSGKHGMEGYYWEKVGTIELNAGEALLQLKDTHGNYGRCDAVFLTSTDLNPNQDKLTTLQKFKKKNKILVANNPNAPTYTSYLKLGVNQSVEAEMDNGKLKFQILKVKDALTGLTNLVVSSSFFKAGQWMSVTPGVESNRIYLLSDRQVKVNFASFYPAWENTIAMSTFESNGRKFEIFDPTNASNPFSAGDLQLCRLKSVVKTSARELSVTYVTEKGQVIKGVWTLKEGANHLGLTLSCQAAESGNFSFVVSAFQPIADNAVVNVQLPPLFQYQRLPQKPILLPSALTPQPLSIVETKVNTSAISYFVSGTLSSFSVDWGTAFSSPMGFSLKNENNMVQPVAFSPVLGLTGSKLDKGQTLQKEFVIGAVWDNWSGALEYLSDNIYQVKDYRKQSQTSLTQAAFNMVDLVKNNDRSGWDDKMKGFYDIEENPTIAPVTAQVVPLGLLSAAVLGQDEDLYIRRALPTIEYTLSRRGYRWSNKPGTKFTPNNSSLKLSPYSGEFNVAYFEGVYKLLNESNPWLIDLALPKGKLRSANAWTEKLAAYRLTNDQSWLNAAVAGADYFLSNDVYGRKTEPVDYVRFYNKSFYANWWDLTDIYELTKDAKYLDAAAYTAFFTIAGLRSYPKVSDDLQTIHPGNDYSGVNTIWWKKDRQYRLGYPRTANDVLEKQVPASEVSPVGLGLEQPSTFFLRNGQVGHIFLSNWAPNLLRVFQHTQRPIFETYARNSIIGRFANYPGYYGRGFTDLSLSPDYPIKGPDVTSIYYHHIPAHYEFTIDYLVTEATVRSKGNISFPYSKDEGFVWFNNRIYGGSKGKIFGDNNVSLILKKDLVEVSNPAVNYITGSSENMFWVVLLNESSAAINTNVTLGTQVDVAVNSTYKIHATGQNKALQALMKGKQINAKIDAKGISTYAFPLKTVKKVEKLNPVQEGMKVVELGEEWGKLFVFRIRSPFGWDSIYAYIDTPPKEQAEAALQINQTDAGKINSYPYEWSFHPMVADKDANLVLSLNLNGNTRKVTINMKGNKK